MATKTEPSEEFEAIKNEIMQLVQAYENGIDENELSKTMASTPSDIRVSAVNSLLRDSKIQLCKRGADLIYRVLDSKTFSNHSNLQNSSISFEEKVVYQVVESAGSKGIWNREIRNQTKLPLNQMSKILKNLETKKLIKAVKSVTASKKKLYMLYGLEPDKSVTGGAWYSGNLEFEVEYVQVLQEQCYHFIKRRLLTASSKDFVEARDCSLVSSVEVKEYIDELKISTIKLTLQDIEMVLETLVFDGSIEKIVEEKQTPDNDIVKSEKVLTSDEEDGTNLVYKYRALSKSVISTGVMRVPCGQCPYIHECRRGAVINPEKCLYFERWFST